MHHSQASSSPIAKGLAAMVFCNWALLSRRKCAKRIRFNRESLLCVLRVFARQFFRLVLLKKEDSPLIGGYSVQRTGWIRKRGVTGCGTGNQLRVLAENRSSNAKIYECPQLKSTDLSQLHRAKYPSPFPGPSAYKGEAGGGQPSRGSFNSPTMVGHPVEPLRGSNKNLCSCERQQQKWFLLA